MAETYDIPTSELAAPVMLGDMGVMEIRQGDTQLYRRRAAYFFLRLTTDDNNQSEGD